MSHTPTPWLLRILTLTTLVTINTAFNVDLSNVTVFHGPAAGGYFGYSVSLHRNSQGYRVLVGAPKSTSVHEPEVREPGAVFDCPLSGNGSCQQIALDTTGNSYGGEGLRQYVDQKDHQWLGVSLDSHRHGNGSVVVCGHRWVNVNLTHTRHHFGNGLCYEIDGDLEFSSVKKLIPLVAHRKQVKLGYINGQLVSQGYDYGFGQAGLAAEYTKSGEVLLLGAPGVLSWTGQYAGYSETCLERPHVRAVALDRWSQFTGAVVQYVEEGHSYVLRPPTTTLPNAYTGYSVTSGYFFDDDVMYYVTSSPRLEYVGKQQIARRLSICCPNGFAECTHATGKAVKGCCRKLIHFLKVQSLLTRCSSHLVNIMPADDPATKTPGHLQVYIFTGNFDIRTEFQGKQFGSYFGAALCAVDLNDDGFDELLVGAPHYHGRHGDEGAVFVFINRLHGIFSETESPLVGSASAWSHFGSAITAAGDLNMDGYNDVAIGSPYEDGGVGAVYIYHGASGGINQNYVQRITPRDIGHDLRSFGGALDSNLDMDDNGYPDLAVGSYESDQVVLLRTRPVVYLEAQIAFGPNKTHIDLRRYTCAVRDYYAPCLAVYIAFRYYSPHGPETLDMEYTLRSDVLKTDAFLLARGRINIQGERLVSRVRNVTSLRRGQMWQQRFLVAFDPEEKDLITPVEFLLSYNLATQDYNTNLVPLLDVAQPTSRTAAVQFLRDCGVDNICHSDLRLTSRVWTPSAVHEIVLGQLDLVYITCEVLNTGEPAYMTEIIIEYPESVKFVRVNKSSHDGHIVCIPLLQSKDVNSTVENGATLLCEVGHPISSGQIVNFTLALDTSRVPSENEAVEIHMEARTGSDENGAARNNIQHIVIPMVTRSNLTVSGKSEPEQYEFDESLFGQNISAHTNVRTEEMITHYYDFLNSGPGTMPYANITISVPMLHENGKDILTVESIDLLPDGQSRSAGGSCYQLPQQAEDSRNRNRTPRLAASLLNVLQTQGRQDVVNLSCRNAPCREYVCVVGDMGPGESLLLTISLRMHMEAWLYITDFGSSALITTIAVYSSNSGTSSMAPNTLEMQTPIYPMVHLRVMQSAPLWVLLVSVVSGIFVLLVVAIILKRCGFFRRRELEILQRLLLEMELDENLSNEQRDLGNGGPLDSGKPVSLREGRQLLRNGRARGVIYKRDTTNDNTSDTNGTPPVPGDGIPLPTRNSDILCSFKRRSPVGSVKFFSGLCSSTRPNCLPSIRESDSRHNTLNSDTPKDAKPPVPTRGPCNGLYLETGPPLGNDDHSSCNPAFELESPATPLAPQQAESEDELSTMGAYFIPAVTTGLRHEDEADDQDGGYQIPSPRPTTGYSNGKPLVAKGTLKYPDNPVDATDLSLDVNPHHLHSPPVGVACRFPCYLVPYYLVPIPSEEVSET